MHCANQRTHVTIPATRRHVCAHFADEDSNPESQSDSPKPTRVSGIRHILGIL